MPVSPDALLPSDSKDEAGRGKDGLFMRSTPVNAPPLFAPQGDDPAAITRQPPLFRPPLSPDSKGGNLLVERSQPPPRVNHTPGKNPITNLQMEMAARGVELTEFELRSLTDPLPMPTTPLDAAKKMRAVMHRYDWPTQSWSTEDVIVRVEWDSPTGFGCHRDVYRMHNETWDCYQVAKILRDPHAPGFVYFIEAQLQSHCVYLAEKFNEALQEALEKYRAAGKQLEDPSQVRKMEYAQMWVIEFDDGRLAQVEPMLLGQFRKYTNNDGFVHQLAHSVPLAFSHWTFNHTNGNLMVVDVQGVATEQTDFLTDPQLLSYSPHGLVFGKCDVGAPGMKKFFDSHVCNELCYVLGCSRLNDVPGPGRKYITIPEHFVMPPDSQAPPRGGGPPASAPFPPPPNNFQGAPREGVTVLPGGSARDGFPQGGVPRLPPPPHSAPPGPMRSPLTPPPGFGQPTQLGYNSGGPGGAFVSGSAASPYGQSSAGGVGPTPQLTRTGQPTGGSGPLGHLQSNGTYTSQNLQSAHPSLQHSFGSLYNRNSPLRESNLRAMSPSNGSQSPRYSSGAPYTPTSSFLNSKPQSMSHYTNHNPFLAQQGPPKPSEDQTPRFNSPYSVQQGAVRSPNALSLGGLTGLGGLSGRQTPTHTPHERLSGGGSLFPQRLPPVNSGGVSPRMQYTRLPDAPQQFSSSGVGSQGVPKFTSSLANPYFQSLSTPEAHSSSLLGQRTTPVPSHMQGGGGPQHVSSTAVPPVPISNGIGMNRFSTGLRRESLSRSPAFSREPASVTRDVTDSLGHGRGTPNRFTSSYSGLSPHFSFRS